MIDYYNVLNVSYNASLKEINKAYKREAVKWHPDRNRSPGAKERMIIINEARLILTDNEARVKYNAELNRYNLFKESKKSAYKDDLEEEYVFRDDVLFRWMENARYQARNLAKSSLDDLVGMSAAGFSAFYHQTKYAIALYIVLIMLIIMAS